MRNTELIKAIYDRCPDPRYQVWTVDQYYERCQDIIDMIERERPELVKQVTDDWPQNEAGIDY